METNQQTKRTFVGWVVSIRGRKPLLIGTMNSHCRDLAQPPGCKRIKPQRLRGRAGTNYVSGGNYIRGRAAAPAAGANHCKLNGSDGAHLRRRQFMQGVCRRRLACDEFCGAVNCCNREGETYRILSGDGGVIRGETASARLRGRGRRRRNGANNLRFRRDAAFAVAGCG